MRRCHPIVAIHGGDYMEQIQIVGCKMMECPMCTVPTDKLENFQDPENPENSEYDLRNLEQVLKAMDKYEDDPVDFVQACRDSRLSDEYLSPHP